jgi:hypothetical protein
MDPGNWRTSQSFLKVLSSSPLINYPAPDRSDHCSWPRHLRRPRASRKLVRGLRRLVLPTPAAFIQPAQLLGEIAAVQ